MSARHRSLVMEPEQLTPVRRDSGDGQYAQFLAHSPSSLTGGAPENVEAYKPEEGWVALMNRAAGSSSYARRKLPGRQAVRFSSDRHDADPWHSARRRSWARVFSTERR